MNSKRIPFSRAPSLADVAQLAGVSQQTVSRVVNGSPNIRSSTRARVEEAIAQLRYRPNRAARTLATQRSRIIGVVGSNTDQYGPSSIKRSVENAARTAGYSTSIVNLSGAEPKDVAAAFDHLEQLQVEAVVLIAGQQETIDALTATSRHVPVIVVEGDLTGGPLCVAVDHFGGSRKATEHLIELGHVGIGHVAGPNGWPESAAREHGYLAAMRAAGLGPNVLTVGDWSAASGYRAGQLIACHESALTAVVSANDQMALGIISALAERAISVPDAVSIVGFDDIPEAPYLCPPLTTVSQDFGAIGRRAVRIIEAHLSGATVATEPLIPSTLVVRASTAPPPF